MPQPEPTFAIAVPVGAWTPRLTATFRSLARQTPQPNVALMDASGDARVAALADAFGGLFAVRRHGPDGGQAAAIQDGWDALEGDVLGWLNADDYLAPGALARAAAALGAESADVVTGQSLILDADAAPRGWHPAAAPVDAVIRRSCVVSQPSCFVRRQAVEAVGGVDRSLHYTMDWDLWVRLFDAGRRFVHLDEALSAVIWSRGAKTATLAPRRLSEIVRIVRRNESAATAARTLVGFGLSHLVTYVAPGIRRVKAASGPRPHGLGDDGRVAGRADLTLFHEDEARGGVAIEAEDGPLAARLVGAGGETAASGEGALRLALPLPAGELFRLELEAPSARVTRMTWL